MSQPEPQETAPPLRLGVDVCGRIARRLIDELGDEAEDHALTITYYLVRAGDRVDHEVVLRFASVAADLAYRHASYYVAGRYYEAAARAAADGLCYRQYSELRRRATDAFRRLAAPFEHRP